MLRQQWKSCRCSLAASSSLQVRDSKDTKSFQKYELHRRFHREKKSSREHQARDGRCATLQSRGRTIVFVLGAVLLNFFCLPYSFGGRHLRQSSGPSPQTSRTTRRVVIALQHEADGPIVVSAVRKEASTTVLRSRVATPSNKNIDLHHSDDGVGDGRSSHGEEQCAPLDSSWHSRQYPSCNNLHEISTSPVELSYVASGFQNVVLSVNSQSLLEHAVVLKTLRYSLEFTVPNFESNRRNAIVHEHLTWSPHIADLYGFCGMSLLAPFASNGTLQDLLISGKRSEQRKPTDLEKLRIAVQMAEGLAALHDHASLAHNDFDSSQLIRSKGRFQLNDFHSAKFFLVRKNNNNNNTADHESRDEITCRNVERHPYSREVQLRLDQADVFRMGNEFHSLFPSCGLGQETRRRRECYKIITGREEGGVVQVADVSESEKVVVGAMKLCWSNDPERIAPAREVAELLKSKLHRLVGRQ